MRRPTTHTPHLLVLLAAAAVLCLGQPDTHADILYWDAVSGAGVGGDGAWQDGTGDNWNTDAGGGDGTITTWNNTNQDSALFEGTAGTVTASGTVDTDQLAFGADGYLIDGGTVTLVTPTPSINVDPGLTATINSVLAGDDDANVTIDGGGTLVLGGASSNTFTGGLNLNDGTLLLNKDGAASAWGQRTATPNVNINIGDGTGAAGSAVMRITAGSPGDNTDQIPSSIRVPITVHADGLLDLNGRNEAIHNLDFQGGGNVTIGSGELTIDGIQGADDLNYFAASGGGTAGVITGDTLAMTASGKLWRIEDDPGVDDEVVVHADLVAPTNLRVLDGGNLALLGDNAGFTGRLWVSSASRVTLSGGTYTGELLMDNGTLKTADADSVTFTGDFTINRNPNTFAGDGNIFLTSTSDSEIPGSGRTVIIDNPLTSFAATFTSTNILNKDGSGQLTLTGSGANLISLIVNDGAVSLAKNTAGTNAVGGDLNINSGGAVRLDQDEQIVDSGFGVDINDGGVLDLNGYEETIGALVLNAGGALNFAFDSSTIEDNSQLFVDLDATINGDLTFSSEAGPFLYTPGATLDLLTADSISISTLGTAQSNLAAINGNYELSLVNEGEQDILRMTVLPEPASALLLAAGVPMLLRRSTSRRKPA